MAMGAYEVVTYTFPEPDFRIAVMQMDRQLSYPLHEHPFTELVIILEGWGTHILGDVATPLTAGDIFVVAPGNVHAYEQADCRLINVLFDAALLSPYRAALHALPGYHALFLLEPRYRQQHRGGGHLRLT